MVVEPRDDVRAVLLVVVAIAFDAVPLDDGEGAAILLDGLAELDDLIDALLALGRVGDIGAAVTRFQGELILIDQFGEGALRVPIVENLGESFEAVETQRRDVLNGRFEGGARFPAPWKRAPRDAGVANLEIARSPEQGRDRAP